MNQTDMGGDKRKDPRVKADIPVRYREFRDGVEDAGSGSLTSDVSTGGLRFKTNRFISTACRLIVEFDIPTLKEPIQVVSTVAWVKKANSGEDYEIGNRFMEITEKDRELIAKYVSSLSL